MMTVHKLPAGDGYTYLTRQSPRTKSAGSGPRTLPSLRLVPCAASAVVPGYSSLAPSIDNPCCHPCTRVRTFSTISSQAAGS